MALRKLLSFCTIPWLYSSTFKLLCSCRAIPTGVCSLSSSTGYYFRQSAVDENVVIQLLNDNNAALENFTVDKEYCRDSHILTELVCLFVYPPCIPGMTVEVVGICRESCAFVLNFIDQCIQVHHFTAENSSSDRFITTLMSCLETSPSLLTSGVDVSENQCITIGGKLTNYT